jgi:hypothetical protein
MVQEVLADDEWATALTDTDRRGLTPPFWTHVAPYGEVMHHARPTDRPDADLGSECNVSPAGARGGCLPARCQGSGADVRIEFQAEDHVGDDADLRHGLNQRRHHTARRQIRTLSRSRRLANRGQDDRDRRVW